MRFKREEEEEEIAFQMAPMIDVVFQLIIFFMCVTTLSKLVVAEDIRLPLAEYSREKKGIVEVVVNVYPDGTISILPYEYQVEELPSFFESAKVDGQLKVYIRGDKNTDFKEIVKVMDACAQADIWDVSFATYQEEPNR